MSAKQVKQDHSMYVCKRTHGEIYGTGSRGCGGWTALNLQDRPQAARPGKSWHPGRLEAEPLLLRGPQSLFLKVFN